MQHGLQVGHVVQEPGHKGIELPSLPQQQLGCLNMLLLQNTSLYQQMYTACTLFLLLQVPLAGEQRAARPDSKDKGRCIGKEANFVGTLRTWRAARSIRKAWSCLLALATMFSSRSVTLTGEEGWLPMAETTTSFCCAGSSNISFAAALMRSAAATQVPPNLCTCTRSTAQCCQAVAVWTSSASADDSGALPEVSHLLHDNQSRHAAPRTAMRSYNEG